MALACLLSRKFGKCQQRQDHDESGKESWCLVCRWWLPPFENDGVLGFASDGVDSSRTLYRGESLKQDTEAAGLSSGGEISEGSFDGAWLVLDSPCREMKKDESVR
ncbi:hypothetical protein Bca52824_078521 [Brassica carinata]|uniref:Uncharacterized protein n=1 Tax=Brassica carinata TaxID=52824 RepID=A0A8X7PYR7_BRACI|nr:hypothetical protein Bca52824_078521 [Brassica carinata]